MIKEDISVEVLEPEEMEYSLSGGEFFKQHPEKLLAEPYEASGRFGKVTKFRAKGGKKPIDVLSEIETPQFIGLGITDLSAGASVIATPAEQKGGPGKPVMTDIIEKSEKEAVARLRSAKKKITEFEEPEAKPTIPFEDVLRTYNTALTEDEIKAYLWYMHQQGNTYKGKWLNIFNPTILSTEQEAAYINSWVKNGVLFYFDGKLFPAAVYFSENIYERKSFLEKDKENIIGIYGQEAFDAQQAKVNEVFTEVYNNRLKLDDPDVTKRLKLKPYGDFTGNIMVKNWHVDNETGQPSNFLVHLSSDGSIFWKSKRMDLNRWRDTQRTELSINEAFKWWLKFDRPEIGRGFNYEDIFKYYLDKSKVVLDDKTLVARNRALCKEIGDKLFSKFLAEIILENDRVKIETIWNEQFNGSRGINTDKIPIGFECGLYYPGNHLLEILPEKREAVAFASITGSSLNCYQVGVGKANLLTSDILTPTGWVKMRDIKKGMQVIGKNGKPTNVLKVYPQGVMPAYRVTFSDGAFTEVTGDHLWTVQNIWDRYTGEWRLMNTLEMIKKLYNNRGERIYSIPMVEPVHFEHKEVPVDPYLLGALIGDGGLTNFVTFSNPEVEIQEKIKSIVEKTGLNFTPDKDSPDKDFRISRGNSPKIENTILTHLRALGLIGKKSIDKFIPDLYLYNSVEVRLALLNGLMDTDGYVTKEGHTTQISTSSKRLAENIVELIRSFGGTVNENIKHPKYTYKGELREGHEAYILTIRLPKEIVPFTTKKHLDKYKPKTKYIPVRYINSIEPIGKHEAQCILVDASDHLYVCDEYIVTHNTFAATFIIEQFLANEHCKRPVLVVPNQVYKQFYAEMHGLLPHRKINDLYNLGKEYYEKLLDIDGNVMAVEEGSITILTYEGFLRIGFSEATADYLVIQLEEVVTQIKSFSSDKAKQKDIDRKEEQLKKLLGKALAKTKTNIEDLGFDFICYDEAHALKNIFSSVISKGGKSEDDEDSEGDSKKKTHRPPKRYEIQGGVSTRGIKAYMLCSYIQLRNQGRNVLLLTATPFTNNPLEVYSMLSLVAYQYLKKIGLNNINDFFDNYCNMTYELIINSKLQPVRKEVFKSFDNLQSLQKLIYQFMLHKEAGKPDRNGRTIPLVRPNKRVLPYKGYYNETNQYITAPPEEYIDTSLMLTDEQKTFMEEIIAYAEGKISFDALKMRGEMRAEDEKDLLGDVEEIEGEGEEAEIKKDKKEQYDILLEEGSMDDNEKKSVKVLRGVNFARSVALSPYLYPYSGLGEPDYKNYINRSPKLKYIMECIRTVKKWHEDNGEPVSGQVIYMDRGKAYFHLIKEYLIHELGYKPHEIGIIRSGTESDPKHKSAVQNAFNGKRFDEATKSFITIPPEERVKIVIGTSSIREGMNLQTYSSVLYNAFVDWNPTDQIQLEGRVWRQGNTFKNVRIVIPLMAESMDIFMFQKLEEKTSRINSIWNYDGQTNVLKVEELDPQELKKKLIKDPRVIAEIEVEDEENKINEEISAIDNDIKTANNLISFYNQREKLEKSLSKIFKVLEPDNTYSLDSLISHFEKLLKEQDEKEETKDYISGQLRRTGQSRYDFSDFTDYDYQLRKPWNYGNMKAAVAALKRAKRTFFDKHKVSDDKDAVEAFIQINENEKQAKQESLKHLKSDEYLNERAAEIDEERKREKIKFVPLPERVKEFENLNYLLGLRDDKAIYQSEDFVYEEIQGCPPMKDGKPDISPEGIEKLEACLNKIPQTKDLNVDEKGEYTQKRKKLHENIKAELRAGLKCKATFEQPIAILMGGVPGSGKTTWLKKYAPNLTKEKIFKIDADEIRSKLPEYQGWNSKATHKETQDIYKSLIKELCEGKPCRFDMIWDGTMNKAQNYLPLIADLKHLEYQVYMIYVKVPWDVSRKRSLERYAKAVGRREKGRYVPMEVIDEANQNGAKAFEDIKFKADGYMMIDGITGNLIEKGGQDILADRGYFDKEPTEKDAKIKIAKAKAIAQKQRIRILKLKEE